MDGTEERVRIDLEAGGRITVTPTGAGFEFAVSPRSHARLTREELWKLAEALDALASQQ